MENLPNKLLKGKDLVQKEELLETRLVIIQLSAHWCPPCRMLTPLIAKCYDQCRNEENNISMEIVFMSLDKDEEAFKDYQSTQPWLAVPYDSPQRDVLKKEYANSGIPSIAAFVDGELVYKGVAWFFFGTEDELGATGPEEFIVNNGVRVMNNWLQKKSNLDVKGSNN